MEIRWLVRQLDTEKKIQSRKLSIVSDADGEVEQENLNNRNPAVCETERDTEK